MNKANILLVALALGLAAQSTNAADFSDPTWPCIQRKVEKLSIGQMLPYIIPELPDPSKDFKNKIEDLSLRLSLRKFSIDEVEPWIDGFAKDHPSNAELGALFKASFDKIGEQRSVLITGIARYAAKQTDLSKRINGVRATMKEMLDVDEPDFDEIDAIEERLEWDERIYQDRVRALRYVCESPVFLEKRAFALGRIFQKHWQQ